MTFLKLFLLLATTLSATAAQAARINPFSRELIVRMSSSDPEVYVRSYGRFYFAPTGSTPMGMRTYAGFDLEGLPGKVGGDSQLWFGSVDVTVHGVHNYSISGMLTAPGHSAPAQLNFASDGTWTCTGDCDLYVHWWPVDRTIASGHALTGGSFDLVDAPLPAGALLGLTGLSALAPFARRRKAAV